MNRTTFCLLAITYFLGACTNKNTVPESARNSVQISVERLESDLWALNLDRLPVEIPEINKKYGTFANLYFEQLIMIGKTDNPAFPDYLKTFLTDYTVNTAYTEVQKAFPDVKQLNKAFSEAFSLYHHYLPQRTIPEVYTFISGFNQSVVTDSAVLAIGLDKYLGATHEVYKMLGWERYLMARMTPAHIVPDAIYSWLVTEFAYNDSADNLINRMIYQGRAYAMTRLLLPNTPDSLIFGFTGSQTDWCYKNEKQMWTYFVENKLLFDADPETFRKFVTTAPYTKDFTDESPGQAALWLGCRIVESYARTNAKITPDEWMSNNNYQSILTNSGYRP